MGKRGYQVSLFERTGSATRWWSIMVKCIR